MAHNDARIAELEAELAKLKADRDAENVALATPRPQGIPPTWKPIIYSRGLGQYVVAGWLAPEYQAAAYLIDRTVDRIVIAP